MIDFGFRSIWKDGCVARGDLNLFVVLLLIFHFVFIYPSLSFHNVDMMVFYPVFSFQSRFRVRCCSLHPSASFFLVFKVEKKFEV